MKSNKKKKTEPRETIEDEFSLGPIPPEMMGDCDPYDMDDPEEEALLDRVWDNRREREDDTTESR